MRVSFPASRIWNDLPQDLRKKVLPFIAEVQIRQICEDQEKAKSAYNKFMRETNDHIKNLTESRERYLKEIGDD